MMQKFNNNFFNPTFANIVFCPRGHLTDYHLPTVDNCGHLVNYHLPHFVHVVIERPLCECSLAEDLGGDNYYVRLQTLKNDAVISKVLTQFRTFFLQCLPSNAAALALNRATFFGAWFA